MNIEQNYNMSDDTFLGVLDTDGSIIINLAKPKTSEQKIGVRVEYYLGQSASKSDLVEEVAKKFSSTLVKKATRAEMRVSNKTPVGQAIQRLLQNKKPLNPGRRRDFLISEAILNLLKDDPAKSPTTLVTITHLAFNTTQSQSNLRRKDPIEVWLNLTKASKQELLDGEKSFKEILNIIEKEVQTLSDALINMKLSLDYVLGAHFGDGSLTISLIWKPNKANRRRIVPEWTISGENKAYCQAFVNTFGGDINTSSPNCYKFRLYGIEKNQQNVLPFFEKAPWMPQYKLKQFQIFQEVLLLLANKEHFTMEGTIKLVNLVYGVAEKGGRKYSKEDYIEWGIAWLKRNRYIR